MKTLTRTRNPQGNYRQDAAPQNHLLVLRRVALDVHEQTGHDLEDLYSEACVKYLLCRDAWDPTRGAFSTHMYRSVRRHLKDYLWRVWDQGKLTRVTSTGDKAPVSFVPLEQVEQSLRTKYYDY